MRSSSSCRPRRPWQLSTKRGRHSCKALSEWRVATAESSSRIPTSVFSKCSIITVSAKEQNTACSLHLLFITVVTVAGNLKKHILLSASYSYQIQSVSSFKRLVSASVSSKGFNVQQRCQGSLEAIQISICTTLTAPPPPQNQVQTLKMVWMLCIEHDGRQGSGFIYIWLSAKRCAWKEDTVGQKKSMK